MGALEAPVIIFNVDWVFYHQCGLSPVSYIWTSLFQGLNP